MKKLIECLTCSNYTKCLTLERCTCIKLLCFDTNYCDKWPSCATCKFDKRQSYFQQNNGGIDE